MDMELLAAFGDLSYPNEIGPGVWDIHSPRVPTEAEIVGLLGKALGGHSGGTALGEPRLGP